MDNSRTGESKPLMTTILITYFLGSLGIHHFYLGNKMKGIIFLVFSWTLIPAIISFISVIGMTRGSVQELNAKYGVKFEDNCSQTVKTIFLVLGILGIIGAVMGIFNMIFTLLVTAGIVGAALVS